MMAPLSFTSMKSHTFRVFWYNDNGIENMYGYCWLVENANWRLEKQVEDIINVSPRPYRAKELGARAMENLIYLPLWGTICT